MTVEDFFSLTEMNNGLTSPSQVRELITVMEKERDLVVKNAANSTRQRSAVASAIAATENQDCLDLFIQLGGLHFISNLLKDAQKLSNDTTNCLVEESIFDLFRALEKLHLDYEKSVAFGIRTTAEILIDHKSSKVQDKARVLLESWKIKKCSIDMPLLDVCKAGGLIDGETRETFVKDDQVLSSSVGAVHREQVESAPVPNKILDPSTDDEKLSDHVSSSPSLPKLTESCSPDSSRQDIMCTNSDIHSLKSKTSEDQPFTSSSDVVGMEDVTEESSQKNSNAGSKNPCDEGLSNTDFTAVDSNGKGDGGDAKSCGNSNAITPMDATGNSNEYANGAKTLDPQEIETSQDAEAAQEAELNVEKSHNSFDLNQEVFSEDFDHRHHSSHQSSTPVSDVSASRALAADPKLPCAPLQFEGNLSWKGSSAFHRVPESDFDLNVTESVEELYVETNSNRSEHLELDLNLIGEDGGSLPLSRKNIDLNDGPSFLNAKKAISQNVIDLDSDSDSAISIMGMRVEVNRKDFASQTPELAFDVNSGRMCNFMGIDPATPYVHSSHYGYSNFAPGPAIPFSSPILGSAGPVSHIDSRGMPVIPPFLQQSFGLQSDSFNLSSGVLFESGNKDPVELELFLNSASSHVRSSSGVLGKRKELYPGYNDYYYPLKRYTLSPWNQS